ncbi:GlsB/YeaQ/YmgE family stress response membrane protein [uncultured Jatrophihabitans sp.]|uniref:GlsB/YeaQ/YmgE family stress response membrane protein n=1 Tax=uncultured Jatrophihabitans sp. TaxID=1610747 RepID=UPI0035CC9741
MLLVILAVLILLLIVLPLIGYTIWTLLSVAVVGLIIGGLARLVLPGRQNISVLATILLGWIGSLLGGFVGYRLLHVSRFPTVLLEIAAAAVLVALYSGTAGARASSWSSLPQRRRW